MHIILQKQHKNLIFTSMSFFTAVLEAGSKSLTPAAAKAGGAVG